LEVKTKLSIDSRDILDALGRFETVVTFRAADLQRRDPRWVRPSVAYFHRVEEFMVTVFTNLEI
jgi:hypothetical protein